MSPETLLYERRTGERRLSPPPAPSARAAAASRPSYDAFRILQLGFVAAPILAGLDKFFHVLVNWDLYLAPQIARLSPVGGHGLMLFIGALEVAAGVLVARKPRLGGLVVAVWLWGIIANLLMIPGFYDVALRDFGLSLGALALSRLAAEHDVPGR
jgi:hypothetical protein